MASVPGYLALVVLAAGFAYVCVSRVKHADYAFMAEKSEIVLPAIGTGVLAATLTAVFYVIEAGETGHSKDVNYYLIVGMVVMCGGFTGVVLQLVSAVCAKLWRKIARV